LSVALPMVETADKQIASGIVEIGGADVEALIRRDGASRKPALVRRFRRSKKAEWEWIAGPVDGVPVTAADVITCVRSSTAANALGVCSTRARPRAAQRHQHKPSAPPGRARRPSTIGMPSQAPMQVGLARLA
jgi:hypothetical protein